MIFVDTSFWFALRRRRDANHDVAVDVLRPHADQPLVSTDHVRGETWTLLRRREGHRAALAFLDATAASPRLRLLHADDAVEGAALSDIAAAGFVELRWTAARTATRGR